MKFIICANHLKITNQLIGKRPFLKNILCNLTFEDFIIYSMFYIKQKFSAQHEGEVEEVMEGDDGNGPIYDIDHNALEADLPEDEGNEEQFFAN